MYEKTLIIIKPDGVQRRLCGTILQRFESAGLKIHATRFEWTNAERSRAHYAEHVDKAFYPSLEKYITLGPILVMVLGGVGAIAKVRQMVGKTSPAQAAPGTIRGDLAHQAMDRDDPAGSLLANLVHASANAAEAETEIRLWFSRAEVIDYEMIDDTFNGI